MKAVQATARTSILRVAGDAARITRFRIRGRAPHGVLRGGSTQDVTALVGEHFDRIGEMDHPSRETLHCALSRLGSRPARILETGTAAWGTRSTLLFASYVQRFGGEVLTIDTRLEPALATFRTVPRSVRYLIGDSARVLRRPMAQNFARSADLVYLDSWDVDSDEPYASAAHGVAEFMTIAECLKPNALVLIDDTPVTQERWGEQSPGMTVFAATWGVPMGKGSLVRKIVESSPGFEVLMHDYQLLIRKT